ncbi:hybrid sensor histidine kinase/response regulator, partial [Fangia hongkongensis]
ANQALISMENEAFSLVKNNNLNEAKAILFSTEYQKQKRIYADGMEELLNQIQSIAKDKQDKIESQFHLMLSIMIIGLIVLILIWFVIFWVLQRYAKSEKHTQNELRKLNETLDMRVKARTAELEKAQEKLLSSQQFLEAIFSSVNSFLFVLDKELNMTMINQTALNKLNFSETELVGENIFSLLDAGTQKDKIQEVLLSTEDHTIETELISKDKKHISVLFTCTTINKSTLSPAIICAAQDISELKETKEQLMQAQKLESIGKLAGGVAHDFNNLLMGIMGHADLLLLKLKDEKLLKHVQAISSSSQKASGLTKQLLGFARKGQYERSVLNANTMIEETLLILKSVLNKNIKIDCKLQEDLWPIEGDSGQISQVLMNIAVNAKDAMPEGGHLQFTTSNIYADESFCQVNTMLSIGAYIDISISDSGIGMSKEVIQKMFEPFYTTKEVGKGTGLGLSMVYGIIKNHQGEIRVYSEPGVGTLFHIYLPAKVEIADESISDKVDLTPLAKLKTVLIADDEKLLLDLSTDILNKAVPEVNILHAKTGKALMEAFELNKNSIDLVITDFMMPELSGLEVIEKIHQSKKNLPILLLSGYDKTDEMETLLKDRQIAFLQKPYQKKAFLQVICHLLEVGKGGGNA